MGSWTDYFASACAVAAARALAFGLRLR